MKSKLSSHITDHDNQTSIDHLEELLQRINETTINFFIEKGIGKAKVAQFKLDRGAYDKKVIDDRIEIPEGRKDILIGCLEMLEDRVKPVITLDDIEVFLQMNFKGFGDKPNERVKLKYNMKKTHLMYFFRLVCNAIYADHPSNSELRGFRNAVAQSFIGYESLNDATLGKYFKLERPYVYKAFARRISRLQASDI